MKWPVRVGILGGGQLARMLVGACEKGGVTPAVYATNARDCALQVTRNAVIGSLQLENLETFAQEQDLLIIENEFLNLDLLKQKIGKTPLWPSLQTLRRVQNKLDQKKSFSQNKISTLDFVEVRSEDDFKKAASLFRQGLVLKKAEGGYDGKGTFVFDKKTLKNVPSVLNLSSSGASLGSGSTSISTLASSRDFAWSFVGYAEPLVKFKKEIAVIAARNVQGDIVCYPVIETYQKKGMCYWAQIPAGISKSAERKALTLAKKIMTTFDAVGVFGIEMFLLGGGEVVVNEIAPRVHNSGHVTMDTFLIGQFELHLRAVLGQRLPKVIPMLAPAAAMVNIIGEKDGESLSSRESLPSNERQSGVDQRSAGQDSARIRLKKSMKFKDESAVWIHWYGKSGTMQGRKLGHINAIGRHRREALSRALKVRKQLDI